MKLNVKAMGLTLGLLWGISSLVFGIWATMYAPVVPIVEFMGQFYFGYEPGFIGALIGFFWGFVDAGIGGVLIAWVYNFFAAKF